MSKDVLWHDGRESNKVVEPPDRCYLGGVTYISVDRVLEIIDKMPNANPSYWNKCDVVDRVGLREEILALKGGEQE